MSDMSIGGPRKVGFQAKSNGAEPVDLGLEEGFPKSWNVSRVRCEGQTLLATLNDGGAHPRTMVLSASGVDGAWFHRNVGVLELPATALSDLEIGILSKSLWHLLSEPSEQVSENLRQLIPIALNRVSHARKQGYRAASVVGEEVQKFIEHVANTGGGDPEKFQRVTRWLADRLQDTVGLPPHAVGGWVLDPSLRWIGQHFAGIQHGRSFGLKMDLPALSRYLDLPPAAQTGSNGARALELLFRASSDSRPSVEALAHLFISVYRVRSADISFLPSAQSEIRSWIGNDTSEIEREFHSNLATSIFTKEDRNWSSLEAAPCADELHALELLFRENKDTAAGSVLLPIVYWSADSGLRRDAVNRLASFELFWALDAPQEDVRALAFSRLDAMDLEDFIGPTRCPRTAEGQKCVDQLVEKHASDWKVGDILTLANGISDERKQPVAKKLVERLFRETESTDRFNIAQAIESLVPKETGLRGHLHWVLVLTHTSAGLGPFQPAPVPLFSSSVDNPEERWARALALLNVDAHQDARAPLADTVNYHSDPKIQGLAQALWDSIECRKERDRQRLVAKPNPFTWK